jgi:DNA polymerase III delta prime subunit
MTEYLDRSPHLARLRELAWGDSLPPSLLFVGPEGSGKEACALELAFHAICDEAGRAGAAGAKLRRLAHPDLYYTCPVERTLTRDAYRALLDAKAAEPLARVKQPGSAILPIGDREDPGLVSVRAIRRFVQAPPFEGRRKVVIVGDAHRMNRQAANALLKTLEEPPPSVLLCLCTHQPHLLPATIPSRCARVKVPAFSEAEVARHLTAQHGVEALEASRLAAVAGGNARRALDLVDEQSREIASWADLVLGQLWADRPGELCAATERIAKSQAPTGAKTSGRSGSKRRSRASTDSSLSASRDVGMRFLDFLMADLILLARIDHGIEVEASIRQSLPDPAGVDSRGLALSIGRLQRARGDLARNLNVGLVLMQSLLEVRDRLHPASGQSAH